MKEKYGLICIFLILASCSTSQQKQTNINSKKELSKNEIEAICSQHDRSLPLIGEVETIEIANVGSFKSRIDTGAKTVSINAQNIKLFLKGGEDYVSFTVTSDSGNKKVFEKKVQKTSKIKSANSKQNRHFVLMDLVVEGKKVEVLTNLNDRSTMDYKLLIGRNLLRGQYAVDTSRVDYIKKRSRIDFKELEDFNCENSRKLISIGTLEKVTIDKSYTLKSRIDSGASRTSLHAVDIERFNKGSKKYLRFKTLNHKNEEIIVEKPFAGIVPVRSALHKNPVKRYIVNYKLKLGLKDRTFRVSLADRSKLKYKLLIGRDFINDVYEVDTSKTYIFNK